MQFNLSARKLAVLTLAGVISIAGTGIAFAAGQSETEQNANRFHPNAMNFEEMSAVYQTALDGLVDDGTITQEQAEAVTESMTAKGDKINTEGDETERSMQREHKGPMSSLVDAETITQEQADSIMAAMKDAKDSGESLSDILKALVNEDVLTEEQADTVTEYMPARGDRIIPVDQTEKGEKREFKGPMSSLVDDGTLTREQLDSIWEAIKTARDSGQSFSDLLNEMVSEDVLTQEQADVIAESMPERIEGAKPDGQNIPPRGNEQFRSPMSSLVEDGILSQEQADAINEAVREAIEAARVSE